MARKQRTIRNERKEFHQKIAEALSKKPTVDGINNQRITSEQIVKMFANGVPPEKTTRRIANRKGNKLRDARPPRVNGITSLTPFVEPLNVKVSTPSWFALNNTDVDVSIIVPLYKSRDEIAEQILSWDLSEKLKIEVIYIDDFCPEKSFENVLATWQLRKNELKSPIGTILRNNKNGGFGFSCNAGVLHAKGKYLLFLNADTKVTKNWIKPMYELLESNNEIGIVDNLQLKENDAIDSAGSQWDWNTLSFQHIGRNIYKNKPITRFSIKGAPIDLLEAQERDMVTGCCFMISKALFETVGGFDLKYRIGYWEDSDINMKVKSLNKKIYYQPNSIIYHKVGHSAAGSYGIVRNNRDFFQKRWVDTQRIDQYVTYKRNIKTPLTIKDNVDGKVVGCVIACNEEEFLEASVESIAPLIDRWYFVIGGNQHAYKSGMCDKNGYPTDGTLEIAVKLAAKYNGKVIEPPGRLWHDKVEMRNAYANQLQSGEWMFMLDGDEVYDTNQLWRVTELMNEHEVLIMNFWLFWNNVNTLGTGSWEQYPQERVVKWKSGYGYRGKNHLHVTNSNNNMVCNNVPCYRGKEKLFYHYSWVRPLEKIRQKRDYYKYQSGNNNDSYVDDVFLKWRQNPELVKGLTHPMGGGDFTKFTALHPASIQKLIDDNLLTF